MKQLIDFNKWNSSLWRESVCRNCKKINRIKNIDRHRKYESSIERKQKNLQREKNRRFLKKINWDWTIPRDLTKKHKLSLLERQNYLCWLSKKPMYAELVETYHIDHIIPLCKWWKHSIHNIHLVLAEENLSKWIKIL